MPTVSYNKCHPISVEIMVTTQNVTYSVNSTSNNSSDCLTNTTNVSDENVTVNHIKNNECLISNYTVPNFNDVKSYSKDSKKNSKRKKHASEFSKITPKSFKTP